MERCRELNPSSPGWGRIVPYLKYYLAGNFEPASNEALLVNTPGCFWDPLLRAAAFGQLGKTEEAREAANELLALSPISFKTRYVTFTLWRPAMTPPL